MDGTNVYTVCWNKHQTHIKSAFDSLLHCKEFTDVTLSCEGKKLEAHRVVLSTCSTYFYDLFMENPCQHPIIILQDVKYENLCNIIKFIYHGEVNVQTEDFQSFLKTAQLLQISGLTQENFSEEQGNEEIQPKTVDQTLPTEKEITSSPKNEPEMIMNDNVCENLVNYLFQNNLAEKKKVKESSTKGNKKKRKVSLKDANDNGNEIVKISDDEETSHDNGNNIKKPSINICDNDKGTHTTIIDNNVSGDMDRVCKICGKQFLHKLSLKQHMPSHTGVTECDICGLVLSRKYELKLHLKKRHNVIAV